MSFGFFLSVSLAPNRRFQSDESDAQEITLPAPIGTVRYRGSPRGTSFSDSSQLLFQGSGYPNREAAETAGRTLKDVVQLASIDTNIPIDVGLERIRSQPGQVVIEAVAEQGIQLLPDVHGLQVFEEIGNPASFSTNANFIVSSPLASFANSLTIRSYTTDGLDEKHSLACQVYSLSSFESSLRSRLLALVTTLDVLSEKILRTGVSLTVAEEILAIVKTRLKDARRNNHNEQELRQLNSLVSIVGALKYVSISGSIKKLAEGIDQDVLSSPMTADEIIGLAYKARNDLIHGGETSVDLGQLLVPLERLTAALCAGASISVKECAEILNRSNSTVLRYIGSGRLRATKLGGQWHVTPVNLKLFMTESGNG